MGRPISWPARLEDPKIKHLGDSTLVVAEDDTLCPEWRMARIGDVALLEKPADSRSPKCIDCYRSLSTTRTAPPSGSTRRGSFIRWAGNTTPSRPITSWCRCGIRSCGPDVARQAAAGAARDRLNRNGDVVPLLDASSRLWIARPRAGGRRGRSPDVRDVRGARRQALTTACP